MEHKAALVVLGVLLLIGGAVAYTMQGSITDPALAEQFEWTFIDRGVDAQISAPKTAVNLRIAGVDVPLGTFTGTCFTIKGSAWELLQNELSGAICYWAGGGVELGVFSEGGSLVLKQGEIEEGTAEGGGFRGNFKALTSSKPQ